MMEKRHWKYARNEQYDGITPDILTCGNLSLNMHSYELGSPSGKFLLPKLEYQLMELFMLNQGICLGTEDILVKVWGYDTDTEVGTVWVYIFYLRKKIEALNATAVIRAKRGIGYTVEETEFSFSHLVRESIASYETSAEQKKITLKKEIEPDVDLYASNEQMRQLVNILLDNAMKYTGESGHIRVTLVRKEKKAIFHVYNTCEQLPK